MLKIKNVVTPSPAQWESAILGARNAMNSWGMSDSNFTFHSPNTSPIIGPHDLNLARRLCAAGTDHRKFMRMLPVHLDIVAPLYWWKEFDTYKIATVANSCSTMHKIHAREFTLEDFSCESLRKRTLSKLVDTIEELNWWRDIYNNGGMDDNYDGTARIYEPKDKESWEQMIQLLPSSYNQKRTVMLNYEVLSNMYKARRNHKLKEWHRFCSWIEELPYSELITGYSEEVKE